MIHEERIAGVKESSLRRLASQQPGRLHLSIMMNLSLELRDICARPKTLLLMRLDFANISLTNHRHCVCLLLSLGLVL